MRFPRLSLLAFMICAVAGTLHGQPAETGAPPKDFPELIIERFPEQSQLLGQHLWQHLMPWKTVPRTTFFQDYLSLAHMWMGRTRETATGQTVQEAYRRNLLSMELDTEGYVHTHQHFSYAHEHGWPFPIWTQAGMKPEQVAGVTAGWVFQNDAEEPDPSVFYKVLQKTLLDWKTPQYYGETAAKGWELENCESLGIVGKKWRLKATGPSPRIASPRGMPIDAFNAPFLQLRWKRTGQSEGHRLPYVEWLRQGDTDYGPDRRVYLHSRPQEQQNVTHTTHTLIAMYRHPLWQGKIERIRLNLAPGESGVTFDIDSFFTCYDTRHPINNPRYIQACFNYFRWTGDLDFLSRTINSMRLALRYQMTEMGGLRFDRIRNQWPGHDGRRGFANRPDGTKQILSGHGIGNNYFDLLPFGWDDMYSTLEYYGALRTMGRVERLARENPGWGLPMGAQAFDPDQLAHHAEQVKQTANRLFWDDEKGRFIGCINADGERIDYGFTFVNEEAIWHDIATPRHARQIMDWIGGKRIVPGDTSTGSDIFRWRFGPRTTTIRNTDWYCFAWYGPETIAWGKQVQDGGSVLGFTFYDLWARLKVFGPDDAWQRFMEILAWKKEVEAAGGYREFYKDGKQGNNLQGGWVPGGLGVDAEFLESILPPSFVIYGLLGLDPDGASLRMCPRLPAVCPGITARSVLFRNTLMDIAAAHGKIVIDLREEPLDPVVLVLDGSWKRVGRPAESGRFSLAHRGRHEFILQTPVEKTSSGRQ